MAAAQGPPAAASSWACSTWSTRSVSSVRSCCRLDDVLCRAASGRRRSASSWSSTSESCDSRLCRVLTSPRRPRTSGAEADRRRSAARSTSSLQAASPASLVRLVVGVERDTSAITPRIAASTAAADAELGPEARAVDPLGQLGVEVRPRARPGRPRARRGAERARGLGRRRLARRRADAGGGCCIGVQPTQMWSASRPGRRSRSKRSMSACVLRA